MYSKNNVYWYILPPFWWSQSCQKYMPYLWKILAFYSVPLMEWFFFFKVVNYEVVHYPQHVEHHVEHPPTSGWEHPGYGRQLYGNDLAYNAHIKE